MNCLWIIIKRFNILGARKHEKTKKELEQEIAGIDNCNLISAQSYSLLDILSNFSLFLAIRSIVSLRLFAPILTLSSSSQFIAVSVKVIVNRRLGSL
ncbi:hypothetical protein [Coleofasciculus sp. E1-EBD-02]|uniref:hypothetical protein n=1 Tax=Coleofasciculus sp. E1-EBD-02 TaxID=3068481 RepID=UPI00330215C0